MRRMKSVFGGIILFTAAAALLLIPQQATSWSNATWTQEANSEPIPAFHTSAPTGPLPATLPPSQFSDPVAQNAYRLAARIKRVLYQQPCYCHCDRSQGHKSLLDCFASKHGSGCGTCIYEDFYAYEQSNKGKSAAQIRAGIIKGEWNKVDAAKYQRPLPEN